MNNYGGKNQAARKRGVYSLPQYIYSYRTVRYVTLYISGFKRHRAVTGFNFFPNPPPRPSLGNLTLQHLDSRFAPLDKEIPASPRMWRLRAQSFLPA